MGRMYSKVNREWTNWEIVYLQTLCTMNPVSKLVDIAREFIQQEKSTRTVESVVQKLKAIRNQK